MTRRAPRPPGWRCPAPQRCDVGAVWRRKTRRDRRYAWQSIVETTRVYSKIVDRKSENHRSTRRRCWDKQRTVLVLREDSSHETARTPSRTGYVPGRLRSLSAANVAQGDTFPQTIRLMVASLVYLLDAHEVRVQDGRHSFVLESDSVRWQSVEDPPVSTAQVASCHCQMSRIMAYCARS